MFRYSGRYGAGRARMQWASGLVALLFVALFARPVVAQTAQAAPAKAARTLLVMGDSLSAAYGLSPAQGWVALTADRIGKTRPGWRVVNASISGETTAGGAARIGAELQRHKPAVVVIALGANDGLRGLPLAQTRANLEKMIKAAQARKAKVWLGPRTRSHRWSRPAIASTARPRTSAWPTRRPPRKSSISDRATGDRNVSRSASIRHLLRRPNAGAIAGIPALT